MECLEEAINVIMTIKEHSNTILWKNLEVILGTQRSNNKICEKILLCEIKSSSIKFFIVADIKICSFNKVSFNPAVVA